MAHDVRIISDIIAASLLVSLIRLVFVKAFLEPAAIWFGQNAYRKADALLGDKLPDWMPEEQDKECCKQCEVKDEQTN